MGKAYNHPVDENFHDVIHTPDGVRSLIERSHLMDLLKELDRDGYDVSGPQAELAALVNYVTSAHVSMSDVSTHLDYCADMLKKMIR